ncbi:hypothetical protein MKX03_033210 [Papaver bracteatum]|nr:hypothetical protein MKX03_033210 [Papaver bracteatum]
MGTKVVELPSTVKFIWKIDNFSRLYSNNTAYLYSDVFSAAGAKWRGLIYPKGSGKVFDHLSVYLSRQDSAKFPVNVDCSLTVTSQTDPTNNKTLGGEHQFNSPGCWGYEKFLPLSQLHDLNKRYLANDTCEIRIEITRKIAKKPLKKKSQSSNYSCSYSCTIQ